MGMRLFSASTDSEPASAPRRRGDPNPYRFTVLSNSRVGNFWVAVIHYPDCTNYEGKKVLILRRDPESLLVLDPHFMQGGDVVARFAPTEEGVALAFYAARGMS